MDREALDRITVRNDVDGILLDCPRCNTTHHHSLVDGPGLATVATALADFGLEHALCFDLPNARERIRGLM